MRSGRLRNKDWLREEYFACLTRHGVTHVFNSWEAMPPVSEQMALPGGRTNPSLRAARFLRKPGRKYEETVKAFQPDDKAKEQIPEARAAGRALIAEWKTAGPERKAFIHVNNRLEGNALETINAMLPMLSSRIWPNVKKSPSGTDDSLIVTRHLAGANCGPPATA